MNLLVRLYQSPHRGSGIIVGATRDSIYIVTARHVLQNAGWPSRMGVAFNFARTRFIDGNVWVDRDSASRDSSVLDPLRDVAVITVPRIAVPALDAQVDFDRAYRRRLRPRERVMSIGCPSTDCWVIPPDENVFIAGHHITFLSPFVLEGKSGGVLLNPWGEVTGMVIRKVSDVTGSAIASDTLLKSVHRMIRLSLSGRSAPTLLDAPRFPRGGYPASVAALALAGANTTLGWPPGGRTEILVSQRRRIGGHVGALRLTSDSIAVSSLVAGANFTWRRKLLAFRPFAEAALGRSEMRRDLGGYYIGAPAGPRYEPALLVTHAFGFGGGFGLAIEVPICCRTQLELMGAKWGFQLPENAADLPPFFLGAGLRVGVY